MRSPTLRFARPSYMPKFVPSSGCVLWLPGQDDPQSATIRDRSGNNNNGTISGATWTRQSKGLWALGYITDDLVSISAANSLAPTNGSGVDQALAIAIWAKMTDASNFIVCSYGSSTTRVFSFFANSSDKLTFTLSDPASTVYIGQISDAVITAYEGQFVQLGAIYTGSELSTGISLLVNGQTVASTANTGVTYAGCTRTANNFQFGKLWSNGSVFANGSMALPRMIINRAVTAAEMLGWYNQERYLFGV